MNLQQQVCALVGLGAFVNALALWERSLPLGAVLLVLAACAGLLLRPLRTASPDGSDAVDNGDALAMRGGTAQTADHATQIARLKKELYDAKAEWERRCGDLEKKINEALRARSAQDVVARFSSLESELASFAGGDDAADASAMRQTDSSAIRDPVRRRELLLAIQEIAAAVLSRLMDVDATSLTEHTQAELSLRFASNEVGTLRICAHNSLTGLSAEFSSPDFLSVVQPDGFGWLIPHARADYAHMSSRFFDGSHDHWPRFDEAAQCRVDSGGTATLTKKGIL